MSTVNLYRENGGLSGILDSEPHNVCWDWSDGRVIRSLLVRFCMRSRCSAQQ